METPLQLLSDCGDNLRRVMAQYKCGMSTPAIQKFITINVPFSASLSPFDVAREGFHLTSIVFNATRHNFASSLMQ
jgi:hypothetical protein